MAIIVATPTAARCPSSSARKPGRTTSTTPRNPESTVAQRQPPTASLRMSTEKSVMKNGHRKISA